jgi:hypothetical protein
MTGFDEREILSSWLFFLAESLRLILVCKVLIKFA